MDLRFNHLDALQWLWLLPVVVVLLGIAIHRKRRALQDFATAPLHRHLVPDERFKRNIWRAVLSVLALVFLVGALIDPRWGVTYRHVPQQGVDIMVVLDVSRSMLAEDTRPNRLERARQFIGDLVDQLGGDRIGLVAFAGTSWLKCPLTVDYRAFRLALNEVDPAVAPRGGSFLGDALRVASSSFTDDLPDHKVIVVFSDGEDHGSFPVEAATKVAAERSIPIYTVGIGDSVTGGRVPVMENGRRTWLTYQDKQVWSRLDSTVLEEVALASGGAYVPVGTGTVDMARVYEERIEAVAKREGESITIKQYHARYQWFAFAALILLLAESWLGTPRAAAMSRPLGLRPAAAAALLATAIVLAGADETKNPAPTALARQAQQALEQERYDEALAYFETLRATFPALAEIPYNMGVAAYRAGDLERAAEYFEQARTLADDPALRARSAYNQGTTAYRRTVEGQQDVAAGMEGLDESTRQLAQALDDYRQALDANPGDLDAKANGELTWRLMEELERLKEQLQEQQQQPQDQGAVENEDPSDQNQPQQEQPQGQDSDEQQQQQQGDQTQQEQQESPSGAEADETQEPLDQSASQQPSQEEPMSREQAERLLQRVRDREQERREQKARAEAARQPPVDKDW